MNEFPGLVDSHLHLLSMESKGLDTGQVLAEFFEAGGRWALDVAVDSEAWDRRWTWGKDEPRLYYTAGVHPSEASGFAPVHLSAVAHQLDHPRCVAVGEIGLDWFRGRDEEEAQRRLFRAQLELAADRRLPVVIHNRQADRELLEDLDAVHWQGQGIQHCFSSDQTFAREALDRGFYLSFAGNLTYPASKTLREVAAWAPADRLLVETDAPYLPPQPFRGQPNRPRNAGVTAQCLAEVRGVSLGEILRLTGDNFGRLFGLDH